MNRRTVFAALVVAVTALVFWSQSRFPQLEAKAGMGNRNSLRGLSFDPLLIVEDQMEWPLRVLYTSVNWAHTNWKGMAFGLVLGAALMTLLATMPRGRAAGGVVLSTLKGLFTGIPLGLCVNCATPVSQGLLSAGTRVETAFATMFSSPTLNPIVVTMLLALFPLHFVVVKITLTILFIVVLMPLLCHMLGRWINVAGDVPETLARSAELRPGYGRLTAGHELEEIQPRSSPQERWIDVGAWVARHLLANLWFIVRLSVPLMLLAGLLGGLAIESLPEGGLSSVAIAIPIVLLAAVGAFLPVPVAFDVIFASMLLAGGLPAPMVMAMLITLGLYSVFPFLIIWRQISAPLASAFFVVTVALGMIGAEIVSSYETRTAAETVAHYTARMAEESAAKPVALSDQSAVEIAARHCEGLGSDASQTCLQTFVFRRVSRGADPAICDFLKGNATIDCREQQRFAVVVAAAVEARNATLCSELSEAADTNACITAVVDELSRDDIGLGLRLCVASESYEAIKQCRFVVVQEWVRIRGDAALCAYLELEAEVAGCEHFAQSIRAALNDDLTACKSLPAAFGDHCLDQIDRLRISRAAEGDATACDALQREVIRAECRNLRGRQLARTTGSAGHCRNLAHDARSVCLREATLRRVDLALSKTEADHVAATTALSTPRETLRFSADRPSPLKLTMIQDGAGLRVSQITLENRPDIETRRFTRVSGLDRGISHNFTLTALDQREPFILGRGIAAGDFDRDGRDDLVLATRDGLRLYRNLGDGHFDGRDVDLKTGSEISLFLVALVDLDNDGWLDIFTTGYGGANFIIFNDGEDFDSPRINRLQNPSGGLGLAAAFADIDQDGDLDIALGNWSFGSERGFAPAHSDNQIYVNDNSGNFRRRALNGANGETLSVLMSDLNGDALPELLIANDHDRPDIIYRIGEDGAFHQAGAKLGFPAMPFHTMSIDSADFNNDLRLDVFATDMSFSAPDSSNYCAGLKDAGEKNSCQNALDLRDVVKNRRINQCEVLAESDERWSCRVGVLLELAIQTRDPQLCERLPKTVEAYRIFCRAVVAPLPSQAAYRQIDYLPQRARNALLMASPDGGYTDQSENAGVSESFWSWNSKAADLDNDGWQDIYIGNGYKFDDVHGNVLFHNRGNGRGFVRAEKIFGLDDRVNTPAYTYIDVDSDGDLDIVSRGVNAPVRLFFNPESANNLVTIRLRDARGNRFGIGASIILYYGNHGELAQIREIKSGGGFLSFDSPVAHFGLGREDTVHAVEILWADGSRSRIDQKLAANHGYLIERKGI